MNIKKVVVGTLNENCYVLIKDGFALIIDPGDEADKIKKVVENNKVLGILITHYHFDHIGALNELEAYYNTKVIDYNNNLNKIGPFDFEIIKTPGHKEDCATYYFKKEKIMFVGDFIFRGSIGRCDLNGGNYNDMLISLNKIKYYDKNIKLYPGHGSSTTLKYELNNNIYLKEV